MPHHEGFVVALGDENPSIICNRVDSFLDGRERRIDTAASSGTLGPGADKNDAGSLRGRVGIRSLRTLSLGGNYVDARAWNRSPPRRAMRIARLAMGVVGCR